MALHQVAQFAIEGLFSGAAIAAAAALVRSWKSALPRIAQLRAELAGGEMVQEVKTAVRTIDVRVASVTTPRARRARATIYPWSFKAPVWSELRAAA